MATRLAKLNLLIVILVSLSILLQQGSAIDVATKAPKISNEAQIGAAVVSPRQTDSLIRICCMLHKPCCQPPIKSRKLIRKAL